MAVLDDSTDMGFHSRAASDVLAPKAPTPPVSKPDTPKPTPGLNYTKAIESVGQGAVEGTKRAQAIDSNFKMTQPELKIPPKPEPKETSPMEMWGSMAIAFAALASLKSRTHMTTALNAAAAGINAMKQRDKETYDHAMKTWEIETANAEKMARYQQDAYKIALEGVHRQEDLAMRVGDAQDRAAEAKVRAIATALQDPIMIQRLDQDGIQGAVEVQEERRRQAEKLETLKIGMSKAALDGQKIMLTQQITNSPEYKAAIAKGDQRAALQMLVPIDPRFQSELAKLDEQDKQLAEKQEKDASSAQGRAKAAYDNWLASPEGQAATPEQKFAKENAFYAATEVKGQGRMYPPLKPDNIKFQAQEAANYRQQIPALNSRAYQSDPDGWNAVIKEAKEINPDFNEAKYQMVQKAREKITTGKDADAVASYVRLNQHLEFFSKLVDKLANGADIKLLDSLAATWGRQTGNTDITSYETALQLVGDEMVKAATGTGAAGALGDREEIKKNFDPSLGKDQLKANIDAVRTLVGGAITSTLNKYRSVMSPEELQAATGLSPEMLRSYHVEGMAPTVTGPGHFGNMSFNVDKTGNVTAVPKVPGSIDVKDAHDGPQGVKIGTYNGKKVYGLNGKWVYEDGSPAQ